MKKLEIPRTVIDEKFEAKDGKIFNDEHSCKTYEDELDFNAFVLDKSKLTGPLTLENWQHYMFSFMNTFLYNPIGYSKLINENQFHVKGYNEKKKWDDLGFNLDEVKKYLIEAFWLIPHYEREYERQTWNNGRGAYNDSGRLYKKEISINLLYNFMFSTGLLVMDDLISSREVDYDTLEYPDEPDEIEKQKRSKKKKVIEFHRNTFIKCFREDSTETLDLAINNLQLDLYTCLVDKGLNGSCSSSTVDLRSDFITLLTTGVFSSHSSGSQYGQVDDAKRLKWLKYILEKDPAVQLFKFRTGKTEYKGKSMCFGGIKEGEEKFINHSIADLIAEVKECKDSPFLYLFKKNNDKVVDLLTNHCGPNFLKANEKNKLPETFQLARDTVEILKEIFSQHPEIIIHYDDGNLFETSRVVEENMPKYGSGKDASYYRYAEEIQAEFILSSLNQLIDGGKTDVCIIRNYDKKGWANTVCTNRKIMKLSEYKNDPKKLAYEIAFFLNDENPFDSTAIEKIADIDLKLFNIKKQKELLEEEERQLTESKKEKIKNKIMTEVTVEQQNKFNYKVKSLILRKEFQIGNIYFNEKKGINLASVFEGIDEAPDAQRKHRITIKEQLKVEGFVDCGDIYGYSKI